ncbi:Signal recognition particle receptor subunit beta [Escovopsis weberi]|uniref:Signal recognition particle receptor subunit beta n=1 Tax=Escovopsis weberi TaxID=150374 RepID=A0A0M8N8C2_ESCWE|nr:Signal recognition particle receptor subunit beta [Escovopsis weberi]
MVSLAEAVEFLLTPSIPVVLLGLLILLGAPVLLHLIVASSSTYTAPPTVLLLGPENAGKTALLTLFERGSQPAQTHTTQTSHAVELSASTDSDSKTASFRYLDDASGTHTKFLLVDTPGHGKLRNVGLGRLARADRLRAVVFVVDAATLGEHDTLATTAAYLYDVLLFLQRKASGAKSTPSSSSSSSAAVPVLVAANKMDLFTALPASLVRTHLEGEITRIRASRSKGLLDSGVGVDDVDAGGDQDGWLGEYGSDKFTFQQMGEFDIDVDVVGGTVMTDEPGADKWWWWIAQRV